MMSVIILSCLYLTGWGGHNLQETIFGLICSIILLKTWLTEINNEITTNNLNLTDFDLLKTFFTPTQQNNPQQNAPMSTKILNTISTLTNYTNVDVILYQMFAALIIKIRICDPFITYFYDNTKDANISGVFTTDFTQ